MHTRKRSAALPCAAIALALALAASMPASAQGKDELWEVSSRMEMPGMPTAMAPQVRRVCLAKNRKDEAFVPLQGDCRMLDGKRVGNKFTYKMDCSGNHPAIVDGAITFASDAYDGRMRMAMKQTNDAMDMTFSGKRVGECTAK